MENPKDGPWLFPELRGPLKAILSLRKSLLPGLAGQIPLRQLGTTSGQEGSSFTDTSCSKRQLDQLDLSSSCELAQNCKCFTSWDRPDGTHPMALSCSFGWRPDPWPRKGLGQTAGCLLRLVLVHLVRRVPAG